MRIERRVGYVLGAILLASLMGAVALKSILSVVGLLVLVGVVGLALGMIFDRHPPKYFIFAAFLPDGRIFVVTSTGAIERYAMEPWARLHRIRSLPAFTSLHVLSTDGGFLAWAIEGTDGTGSSVSLSETKTGKRVAHVEYDGYPSAVLLSPDGAFFGLVSNLKELRLWDGGTTEPVPIFTDPRSLGASFDSAEFAVFSSDSRFLAAGKDGVVHILDLKGKGLTQVLGGHAHISALSYSPDGTMLAVADEGRIQIWNPDSGEQLRVLDGLYQVEHLVFSPDGRFLVGDGNTGTVWFVDVRTGARLAYTYISGVRFSCLSFSPDGRHLIGLSDQDRLHRWRLDSEGRIVSTEMLEDDGWSPVESSV